MQQVQDMLDFPIDTPSDKKLKEVFEREKRDLHEGLRRVPHEELMQLRDRFVNLSMRDRSKSHS